MKAAGISEIKNEIKTKTPAQLVDLCLRLARFKKDNKELLTYLLFESHDPSAYVQAIKDEMEMGFEDVNWSNLYFAKKTLRKLLRLANKYTKYIGSKESEVEILLHFCKLLKSSGKPFQKSAALLKIYQAQLKKIETIVATLHEDLQYEYRSEIDALSLNG